MQAAAKIHGPAAEPYKIREMRLGANWFIWVAILAVTNTLIVFFSQLPSFFWGLGMTQYIDANVTFANAGAQRFSGLAINLGIAAVLAGFGYLARKGNDVAFIIGMFLYIFDAVVALGYRDVFGFGFHALALFFMFKGLLASRRRYDPSVE
jgi:hypothetical protein